MVRRRFIQQLSATPLLLTSTITALAPGTSLHLPVPPPSDQRDFFFKPANAWAADFIPFYAKGQFQLFYLHDWRNKEKFGEGTPWYLVSTKDFVNFAEQGQVLPRGTKDEQDLYVFTGSAIEAQGKYHIFYTGHNPHLAAQKKPQQGVMHAVSSDLLNWQKLPGDTFFAPGDRYEPDDWRDPFVFWNEDTKEYWMLLAARLKTGPSRRRGITALCASKNLTKWEAREPFYAPGLFFTHECPDLFKIGDWWYLLFSEFTESVQTRYRMSRSLSGPWLTPNVDTFDSRAFYAAKSTSDGQNRYLFGWNPTRSKDKDDGGWNWGGNLVVHQLHQEKNGELSVRLPSTVAATFTKPVSFTPARNLGKVVTENNRIRINAPGSFGASATRAMPSRCRIEATVRFEPGTKGCGLMLRTSDDFEQAYYVRLEPQSDRIVFDSWPRQADLPFMTGSDRSLALKPNSPVRLTMLIDGTMGTVYVNDQVAMSTRMYNLPQGDWGVFANEGTAEFSDLRVLTTV